jgi:hypothetical protein
MGVLLATVVEHSPHHTKAEVSSPSSTTGIRRMEKNTGIYVGTRRYAALSIIDLDGKFYK